VNDLKFLRQRSNLPKGKLIVGSIYLEGSPNREPAAAPGVRLVLEGPRTRKQTQTDANGYFQFSGLRPGVYQVRPVLPETAKQTTDPPYEVEVLAENECQQAYVHLKSEQGVTSRVTGKVTETTGETVRDLDITLIPVRFDGQQEDRVELSTKTEDEGDYIIDAVPEGDYIVGINPHTSPSPDAPYLETYYPRAHTAEAATVVHVEQGRDTEQINFVLPPAFDESWARFKVFLPDGQPARISLLYVETLDGEGLRLIDDQPTDEHGFWLLSGLRYRLHVYERLEGTLVCTKPKEFLVGDADFNSNIVLDQAAAACASEELQASEMPTH
jgi:hypothetical protein